MSNKVVSIEDHMPHVTMHTLDGNVHVFPVQMVRNVVAGRLSWDDIPGGIHIAERIIHDWLESLEDQLEAYRG